MACDYRIILKTGEVITFPSFANDENFRFDDLRNSLNQLGLNEVRNLLDKIKDSKNVPLDPSSLKLENVIKTTSLEGIMRSNARVFSKNEITSELLQQSKDLINLLKKSGLDVKTHNVIYTNTHDIFDANYGNVYDMESDTFIINSSPKGDINFISLNKALIDIYILKQSKTIQDLIINSEKVKDKDIQKICREYAFFYIKVIELRRK